MGENGGLEYEKVLDEPVSDESIQEEVSGKKTYILVIAVLLVILILGLVFFFLVSKNQKTDVSLEEPEDAETTITATPLILDSEDFVSEEGGLIMEFDIQQPKITQHEVDKNLIYLTGPEDMTVYMYGDGVLCKERCKADGFEPYLLSVLPQEGEDYYSVFISTITLSETGDKQFAWGHVPLYYYNGDKEPGDILGEGISGKWRVFQP